MEGSSCLQFEFDASWLTGIEAGRRASLFPGAVKDEQVRLSEDAWTAETERLDDCSRLVLEPLVIEYLRTANTRGACRKRRAAHAQAGAGVDSGLRSGRPTLAKIDSRP